MSTTTVVVTIRYSGTTWCWGGATRGSSERQKRPNKSGFSQSLYALADTLAAVAVPACNAKGDITFPPQKRHDGGLAPRHCDSANAFW